MQSGQGKTKTWVLEFAPEGRKELDPLMGWQGSGDMRGQVKLMFETKEAAIAYAERNGLAFQVKTPQERKHIRRNAGYGDNFSYQRRAAWTH